MKPTYEELEAKCQLQQSKLDAINELMGVIEGASDLAKDGIQNLEQQLSESRHEFTAANATIHNLEPKVAQVVAENAGLKTFGDKLCSMYKGLETSGGGFHDEQSIPYQQAALDAAMSAFEEIETPETDAYLAEVRAQARDEGINYAASRLAAAFNHGFVDKPLAEVYDVVRMILTAKEDLANDPAADGLSGEYAEKSLVEFAAQLRQGAKS